MRFRVAIALAVCAFAASASAQTAIPAALSAAIEATQSAKADYAFEQAIEARGRNMRVAFDPDSDPRVRLIAPSQGELDSDGRRLFERIADDLEGLSWCASERLRAIENVRVLREDSETVAYAFQPTAASSRGAMAQLAQHLRGEMVISKAEPDIRSIRVYAPAPFSPLPLTEVAAADARIDCAAAPNGRNYVAMTSIRLSAVAFGQSVDERSVQRTSALEPR